MGTRRDATARLGPVRKLGLLGDGGQLSSDSGFELLLRLVRQLIGPRDGVIRSLEHEEMEKWQE